MYNIYIKNRKFDKNMYNFNLYLNNVEISLNVLFIRRMVIVIDL